MLCQFVNAVDVEILPPYVPSSAERSDPQLFAANVRREYAAASGLPLSSHSQSHFLALLKVQISAFSCLEVRLAKGRYN
jgi:hypothetical protein